MISLLFVAGLALLALTNLGLLASSALYGESIQAQSTNQAIAFTNVNVVPMTAKSFFEIKPFSSATA